MKPRIAPADIQPSSFAFTDQAKVAEIIARYPEGCQQSAVMPLLDLAQRQHAAELEAQGVVGGGWISRAAMREIGRITGLSEIKVLEVATFYSMYNLAPLGKHHVQVCTTTPCWLRGSTDIMKAAEAHTGCHHGETSADGMFTVSEVECLGACVNAPMVQIGDDYYEDLTPQRMTEILEALRRGEAVEKGSQTGRQTSKAAGAA